MLLICVALSFSNTGMILNDTLETFDNFKTSNKSVYMEKCFDNFKTSSKSVYMKKCFLYVKV